MSVKRIIPSIEDNNNAQNQKIKVQKTPYYAQSYKTAPMQADSVSFTGTPGGFNPIVSTMNFIEQGGYAASFIIQDGLGFITPRVGKGLLRGSKKTDENGQPVLDENGKQKREYNWRLARKEFLREIITGPSAFLIPLAMFAGIKKWFGAGNNVKINYINGFNEPFAQYAKANADAIAKGEALDKTGFYKGVYEKVIEQSVNSHLPESEKLSAEKVGKLAEDFAKRQIEVENIMADKSIKGKKAKAAAIEKLEGGTVEDMFMKLKKQTIGGAVNELAVEYTTSQGVKGGSIGEMGKALNDYFSDAVHNVKKAMTGAKDKLSATEIENAVTSFTRKRMGSRIVTNLGIFATIAMFYSQIPKLYKMGLDGNPALKGTNAENNNNQKPETKNVQKDAAGKPVPFTGSIGARQLENLGETVFHNKTLKKVSDIFEFDGNIMSGAAMPVLLYGFCIPPRLAKADDKYDYGEIVFRDMTSFTALLFGAKALARLFSDGITKMTGLALNKKDTDKRNAVQRIFDYLNPLDTHHSVLSSKQLTSKYTNIEDYKGGVNGFMQFIEDSKGDIKKAFAQDIELKDIVGNILEKHKNGLSYADAKVTDIKDALNAASNAEDKTLINKFYEYFKGDNALLRKAKTWNSTFGFVSTIILIPSLIIWIANKCEKMTAERAKKDKEAADNEKSEQAARYLEKHQFAGHAPTMAGFLGNNVR